MDCVGASPEQPSPCGVWEGALVDLAVMLRLCLWARPERRLQLLALRVTQITVHYRNSLFPNCPESHWRNRGVGGIGRKQQQRWCFLKMWQSGSISLWGGRGRVLYLLLHTHTHLSALGKWHHITLEGPILIWDSHYMLMALEWVDCLSAVLQGLTELKFPNCFPSFVPSVGHQSLPGLHSIILRTYFSSWNQTFPIHAIPRFTMTHTVPSDSDFEVPSIPAFSLYQMQ